MRGPVPTIAPQAAMRRTRDACWARRGARARRASSVSRGASPVARAQPPSACAGRQLPPLPDTSRCKAGGSAAVSQRGWCTFCQERRRPAFAAAAIIMALRPHRNPLLCHPPIPWRRESHALSNHTSPRALPPLGGGRRGPPRVKLQDQFNDAPPGCGGRGSGAPAPSNRRGAPRAAPQVPSQQ